MAPRPERLERVREALQRLLSEGGDANFVVLEEPRSGRFVQAVSRRGEALVLLDVPLDAQGLGEPERRALERLGFEVEETPHHAVRPNSLEGADPEVQTALHGWILEGRDAADPVVDTLVEAGVLEVTGTDTTMQVLADPVRGAVLVDRVLREVLGAPEPHDLRVDLHLGDG